MNYKKKSFKSSIDPKGILLFFASLLILTLSFQLNFFGSATEKFYLGHQRDSESLVIGRIVETHNNGVFSHSGLMGRYEDDNIFYYQYHIYQKGVVADSPFQLYRSSAGFQGFFYGFVDSLTHGYGSMEGIVFHRFITSLLLALTLTWFIMLCAKALGYWAAIVSVIMIALSQWLVVFSNNLYWMFFLVFLPFVIVFQFCSSESYANYRLNLKFILSAIFIAILIKCLAGYEYISTILIAIFAPLLFFAIKDNWGCRLFVKRAVYISIAACAGFLAAMAIHIAQLAWYFGDVNKAFSELAYIISKRTHGDPNFVADVYRESLNSSVFEVFLKYWNGHAFDLRRLGWNLEDITFGHLIIFALIISLFGSLIVKYKFPEKTTLNRAILVAKWFSILAPISWFVMAKGHSYIHTRLNHVLWYVPYLLFVFAYFGFTLSLSLKLFRGLALFTRTIVLSVPFLIIISMFLYVEIQHHQGKHELIRSAKSLGAVKSWLSLYYVDNRLLYVSRNCGSDLVNRFFLHLVPRAKTDLPGVRQRHGFSNFDFDWRKRQIAYANWFAADDFCVASVSLPPYPLASLRTGQFREEGRLWESYIDLSVHPLGYELQPLAFSDLDWLNGVGTADVAVVVGNSFENRQALHVGDSLFFEMSGRRAIERITYSERFMKIYVSGALLSPDDDGYPHKILLGPSLKEGAS